jgi:ankyrin repeat protein
MMQLPKASPASSSTLPPAQTTSATGDLPITAGPGDLSRTASAGSRTGNLLASNIPRLSLPDLPLEMLEEIFLRCRHADAFALALTCRTTASVYQSLSQKGAVGWRFFEKGCLTLINKDHLDDAERTTLAHYYQVILSRLFMQTISDADLKKTTALAEKFFTHLSFIKIKELLGSVFNRVVSRHPQPITDFFDKLLSRQSWPNLLQPIFKKLADINLHLCITLMAISSLPRPRGVCFPFPANYRFLLDKFPPEQRTQVEQFLDHLRQTQDNTAIQGAVDLGFLQIIPTFLKDNPRCIDILDKDGWAALMHASQQGRLDAVHLLLELGAKVNLQNKRGVTALMVAGGNGRLDIVSLLLKLGAEVNLQNKNGWTVLMYASNNGHLDIVRLLLDHRAEVNLQDENGWTALMFASHKGHLDIVCLLLEQHAGVNLQDENGWAALMFASHNGHLDIARLLLKQGADVNHQCKEKGNTPLIYATMRGNLEMVRALLEQGAVTAIKNKSGNDALSLAQQYQYTHIAVLLQRYYPTF